MAGHPRQTMFSSRLDWNQRPNALARLVGEKRRAGVTILDLTQSNPTRAGLVYAAGVAEALADPRALVYDPSPRGLREAREAVAGYYAGRGAAVDVDRIVLSASTSEGYAWLFKLLADPGAEVLAPRPSYPLLEFLARLEGLRLVRYPLRYHDGWWVDVDALAAAMTTATRAVVIVNPNNPTGSFLKRGEREAIDELCASRGVAIISDEVFSDFAFHAGVSRAPTLAAGGEALTFAMSGLSKVAGLPQLKLAWIVAPTEAIESLEWIADTYLPAGAPVQHAAARLLASSATYRESLMARLARNLAALGDAGLVALDVEGGWYAIVRLPGTRSDEEWALALLGDDDVLVQPGYFYDFESEAFAVVSLMTTEAVFDEGVRRMAARVAG
jgi:alanine-synthesizing transaminase